MTGLTEGFDFTGADGSRLAGRLELPAGKPLAAALFAHCFTCSKDYHASTKISRALAESGFAVLRFDFTGLGGSGGDFANTSFSSNVADLVAAARALADRVEAPNLLVGHSLGGAAVIRAAAEIPSIGAVATINAPFGPEHLRRLFEGQEAKIEQEGRGHIRIGGRTFPITRRFLEDIGRHPMEEALAGLGRPLLVLHDPSDATVPVENAERILAAARHPKSFVALDGAGHLVSRPDDARYAAGLIAAWARRALRLEPAMTRTESSREEAGLVVVTETGEGKFANLVQAGHHLLPADEPAAVGGDDTGPGPYQYLLAALGACTSMTLRMYADAKGWPVERISVALRHEKVQIATTRIDRMERDITITGQLDPEQRARLLEIADKCPVHKSLHSDPQIITRLTGTKEAG